MDDFNLHRPPIAAVIAEVLAERGEAGYLYRCVECRRVVLTSQPLEPQDCCHPGSLERLYAIEAGGALKFDHHADELRRELAESLGERQDLRLAVLYGSRARVDNRPLSDIDLVVEIVDCEEEELRAARQLEGDLEDRLGVRVQVRPMADVREDPLSLYFVIDEGQVLIDRDHQWPVLESQRAEIERAADRQWAEERARLAETLRELRESGEEDEE